MNVAKTIHMLSWLVFIAGCNNDNNQSLIPNEEVLLTSLTFSDAHLADCVTDYSKASGHQFVSQVTDLDCKDKDIQKLAGIEQLQALVQLDLSDNKLIELTPLEGLPYLSEVRLLNNLSLDCQESTRFKAHTSARAIGHCSTTELEIVDDFDEGSTFSVETTLPPPAVRDGKLVIMSQHDGHPFEVKDHQRVLNATPLNKLDSFVVEYEIEISALAGMDSADLVVELGERSFFLVSFGYDYYAEGDAGIKIQGKLVNLGAQLQAEHRIFQHGEQLVAFSGDGQTSIAPELYVTVLLDDFRKPVPAGYYFVHSSGPAGANMFTFDSSEILLETMMLRVKSIHTI